MCGKASVHIKWKDVYAYASALKPPAMLPPDPEPRVNVSPSRLRRKSEPDSMVWEALPVIHPHADEDLPAEALWPYIPPYSAGHLPMNRDGQIISTANARLRTEGKPFAPTFMGAWNAGSRVLVVVSWFYEFDSRVKPQVPYAVFPANAVLKSVGHHRSPALLRSGEEARTWLHGTAAEALALLRPHDNESMGVEAVPMGIKIPGNEGVQLPHTLMARCVQATG
ncbi:MAG: hypothetical protein EXR85_04400 [Xanthomonadales bacterium]|nr:hypothetical protein [Xanthomonadales bacterium]